MAFLLRRGSCDHVLLPPPQTGRGIATTTTTRSSTRAITTMTATSGSSTNALNRTQTRTSSMSEELRAEACVEVFKPCFPRRPPMQGESPETTNIVCYGFTGRAEQGNSTSVACDFRCEPLGGRSARTPASINTRSPRTAPRFEHEMFHTHTHTHCWRGTPAHHHLPSLRNSCIGVAATSRAIQLQTPRTVKTNKMVLHTKQQLIAWTRDASRRALATKRAET